MKTGDQVRISIEGSLFPLPAVALLVSPNENSLMLQFDGILDGHLGLLPVLRGRDGVYRSVLTGTEVTIVADAGR